MKKLFILLLSLCATYSSANTDNIGKAYYFPFNINFAMPYPEKTVKTHAHCFSFIDQNDFENMLEPTNENYENRMSYGEIWFKDKTYYIDREGIVSDSKSIYQLKSKEQYEKVLKENNLVCK